MRRRGKPAKATVKGKRPLARKSSKTEHARVQDLEKRLAEAHGQLTGALEQQIATAEILRVISRSPTDVQPVFDAIVQSAVRLCNGFFGMVVRYDGHIARLVAHHNLPPEGLRALQRLFPALPASDSAPGRAILLRTVVHVHDQANSDEFTPAVASAAGFRTNIAVPMLHDEQPIGVIAVARREVEPFTDAEIELLKTFADQAVIAVENVRLFTELEARNRALTNALQRETATGESLRLISSSPTNVTPIFEGILRSAVRLAVADYGATVIVDGEFLHLAASHGATPEWHNVAERIYPSRIGPESASGQAITERRPVFIEDAQRSPSVGTRDLARTMGYRSLLMVPMLRQDAAIGVIILVWQEQRVFPSEQLPLLQTFADQAVIAIENVRLFTELQEKNRALTEAHAQVTEALEQQTATSEILRVISRSPTDVQPVFDTIVASAAQLCHAGVAGVFLTDGQMVYHPANYGGSPEARTATRARFPRPLDMETTPGMAILTRSVVHLPDTEDTSVPEHIRQVGRALGFRSTLAVPILREGEAVGAITAHRREPGRFSDSEVELLKTFADQALIAVENVRLFKELEARNRDLTEALDQQTATSEILRTIAHAQTDVQPVFDTIVRSAARLCHAVMASVLLTDGRTLYLPANYGSSLEALAAIRARFPRPLDTESVSGTAILTRSIVHVPDVLEPSVVEFTRQAGQVLGYRSLVTVPMVREGRVVGAINVCRREPGRFSDAEVELLQTFADQAVIAIENVRLFKELAARNHDLSEALDRQIGTADVLRIIAQSPTELQPVLEAIATSALRLCAASDVVIERLEGDHFYNAAHAGAQMKGLVGLPLPLTRRFPGGRAILDRKRVIIDDMQRVAESEYPDTLELLKLNTVHSCAEIPLLSEGKPLGNLAVLRAEVRPFTDAEIALLETFADQAVIAIENVRLFTELQEKNRALTEAHGQVTEALERQTATSEILRAIAHAQTDVQPVFDTIVESAARLCHAANAAVFLTDGRMVYHPANCGSTPDAMAVARARFPRPLDMDSVPGMVILMRSVVHVPDTEEPSAVPLVREAGRLLGFRSTVSVPMLREGEAIGSINVARREPGRFTDAEVELLKTFADQAVIAIENVRLFKELEARTADLTRSVEQLTALGEVGRAVSSTLDLETVLTTIVSRAVQLSGLDGGVVFEYDERAEEFMQRAAAETGGILAQARRGTRYRKGEGVVGRTAITLEPVQVPDISVPGAYVGRMRENLIDSGIRALLAVPMVREDRLIGCLVVSRNHPGDFPAETIELLRTFATQSALAIQNARLFLEIAAKSRQLEAASQHKSEFLANMSHELRTPLNAILGFSEVLAQGMFGEINEKQTEYLHDILGSGRHLLSLINDILDLSKIEAGRMELERADFDLPSAIENALILVRERASRRGIRLGSTIDQRLGMISGDERKVKQVLLNLLSNALKFTPEGGHVDVTARLHNDRAEVSVADTGIGIAQEDQATVFEEFRQVGTADKKAEGTGLGLTLSRKFIELHGGKIWVQSELGRGSTFTFTLPVS